MSYDDDEEEEEEKEEEARKRSVISLEDGADRQIFWRIPRRCAAPDSNASSGTKRFVSPAFAACNRKRTTSSLTPRASRPVPR